ncbi:hypothetical protein B0T17DRAFT_641969 [Bombardia bombarda]|uniref:Uncharacterized protein n=1 Tax=Bombardia bombarda TaxID=252184 RepID=A0AA39WUG5_9PEZI|nr:hypothetical protein B0T17DRAFT_641969 [Bombardia bombarda]
MDGNQLHGSPHANAASLPPPESPTLPNIPSILRNLQAQKDAAELQLWWFIIDKFVPEAGKFFNYCDNKMLKAVKDTGLAEELQLDDSVLTVKIYLARRFLHAQASCECLELTLKAMAKYRPMPIDSAELKEMLKRKSRPLATPAHVERQLSLERFNIHSVGDFYKLESQIAAWSNPCETDRAYQNRALVSQEQLNAYVLRVAEAVVDFSTAGDSLKNGNMTGPAKKIANLTDLEVIMISYRTVLVAIRVHNGEVNLPYFSVFTEKFPYAVYGNFELRLNDIIQWFRDCKAAVYSICHDTPIDVRTAMNPKKELSKKAQNQTSNNKRAEAHEALKINLQESPDMAADVDLEAPAKRRKVSGRGQLPARQGHSATPPRIEHREDHLHSMGNPSDVSTGGQFATAQPPFATPQHWQSQQYHASAGEYFQSTPTRDPVSAGQDSYITAHGTQAGGAAGGRGFLEEVTADEDQDNQAGNSQGDSNNAWCLPDL